MRDQLLESAVGTFRRHGVRGSTVAEIAKDAGVPVGSVYNHFDGKEGLAIEVLNRYSAGTDMSMLDAEGSAVGRLRAHLERQIERTESTGLGYGCVLANFAGELTDDEFPRLREAVQGVLAQWSSALAATVREGQDAGEIRSTHRPEALGTWLVTSLQGATTHAKAMRSRAPLDSFVSITFDAVLA